MRIVYDASATAGGSSLHDCLFSGPDFSQKILDILLRFRSFPVANTAGIEKGFLSVAVAKENRDVLRFVWVNDAARENPEVKVFHFAHVLFWVSSSPFLLNATIEHYLQSF